MTVANSHGKDRILSILHALNRLAQLTSQDQSEQFDYEQHYFCSQLNRYFHALEFIITELDGDARVLDIGNYPGHLQKCLLDLGFDVDGLDIVPERIPDTLAECRNRTAGADIECESFAATIGKGYSAVLLLEVIEHLHVNPLNLLGELNAILPDGGRLIVSTPNLLSLRNRINFLLGRQTFEHPLSVYEKLDRHGSRGHQRLYSRRELVDLLNVFGFDVERIQATDDKSPCLELNAYLPELPDDFQHDVFNRFWAQNKSKQGLVRRRTEVFLNRKFPGLSDTIYLSATRRRGIDRGLLVERIQKADPWISIEKLNMCEGDTRP